MPFIVYLNPDAPTEHVDLRGVGHFVQGVPQRVNGDLIAGILGEVGPDGRFERNCRFAPAPDPEVQQIIAESVAAHAAQQAPVEVDPAALPEPTPDDLPRRSCRTNTPAPAAPEQKEDQE